jgi:Xaa-Pro dipeptidase
MLINESRAAALMDAAGLDALVGTRVENVFYLSGIYNISQMMFPYDQQCYAVVTRDQLTSPTVVISTGDWDQSTVAFPGLRATVHYGTFIRELPEAGEGAMDDLERKTKIDTIDSKPRANALEALIATLEELGLTDKRIGIDEKAFNPSYWAELERRLPNLKAVPAADLFRSIRMVKTEEEIRRLRQAAIVTEGGIKAAVAVAREGVTEREMVRAFQHAVIDGGGSPTFTMIRFGRNAALGQIPAGDTKLRPGDMIWFDVGCLVEGYWADIARIFTLGEPSKKLSTYYNAMLVGEQHAIDITRAGMTSGELFEATVKAVQEAGVPHYRRHHVGHGIGVEVYDSPLLAPGQTHVLENGMVINIETPYYELAFGAVHVEDPFVIREGGNEVLTTLSRDLGIIPL